MTATVSNPKIVEVGTFGTVVRFGHSGYCTDSVPAFLRSFNLLVNFLFFLAMCFWPRIVLHCRLFLPEFVMGRVLTHPIALIFPYLTYFVKFLV
ncbi:MAG: hypothetical protein A2821_00295 [Candidatus Magasanikbacteria bacterium RIFCSPHIGHO2_01_FULL_41_23]|nr:MAG: hypothetical protein A2821_00295 [Candidatus Magasanikbacteria bacterium RIFCSPHIGHO2_01_FULL_41_23]OGH76568.1 MAG: hypothetical protein A3F22_04475 [Candidatus Magasanikbacteria bacterium RIFCSPHIGHO2_12_FULL_41_16]